jgi:hypothetical protein
MRITTRYAALFVGFTTFGLCLAAVNGADLLKMEVTPAIQREPAIVTVRVTVEASPDNRMLLVTAKSPNAARTSQVPIDGANDPTPLKVFEFRSLPTGLYEITGVLMGPQGARATIVRLAKIEPAVGSR